MLELMETTVDGEDVQVRCFYPEGKVAVTSDGDISRKQFFFGEDEMFKTEASAIKAASSYVDGLKAMAE